MTGDVNLTDVRVWLLCLALGSVGFVMGVQFTGRKALPSYGIGGPPDWLREVKAVQKAALLLCIAAFAMLVWIDWRRGGIDV